MQIEIWFNFISLNNMNFPTYPFLLNCIFCLVSGTSRFYEDSIEYKYDCSVKFDYPRHFDCACIIGLWGFYGSTCQDVHFAGGENQFCFNFFDTEITKAVQILKDKNHLVLQKSNGILIPLNVGDNRVELCLSDVIVTGSQWTVMDDTGKTFCLKTTLDTYSFFDSATSGIQTITIIKQGCMENVNAYIKPSKHVVMHKETKNICRHRVVKRQAHKKAIGRSFFGGPGQKLQIFNQTADPPPNSTIIYDEDYSSSNATVGGNGTKGGISDAIASEIWNFLEAKLDDILGIRNSDDGLDVEFPNTTDKQTKRVKRTPIYSKNAGGVNKKLPVTSKGRDALDQTLKPYKSPIYQFLELSKEVMKKTCPVGYVNPDFFDLAVSTFINIQKKHLRFPEGATSYSGYRRIVESFRSCIDNATEFNFTIDPCASRDKPVSGIYCAFDNCTIEINMYGGFENFEPIVETVWNIFKNAHSYCFNHFNKYYNDHHRFTNWMIPLFQNPINEIWRNGTATGLVYGGAFGNQENVQTAVSYCTVSSQMLSKYPWDLPRPEKIDELSKPTANRRKRQIVQKQDGSAQCLSSQEVHTC